MHGMPDTFNGREGKKFSSKRRGAHKEGGFLIEYGVEDNLNFIWVNVAHEGALQVHRSR